MSPRAGGTSVVSGGWARSSAPHGPRVHEPRPADRRGEPREHVGPPFDEQEVAHLGGEDERRLAVLVARGRGEEVDDRPQRERGELCRPLLGPQARERSSGTVRWRSGSRLRERGQGVPQPRRVEAGQRRALRRERRRRLGHLLLGYEPLDRLDPDALEAGLPEQGDEVVLLLPHAGEADREDLEQAQQLLPARRGSDREPPHAVAEEAEGERALAVLLDVDDVGPEQQLERVHLEVESAVGVEEPASLVAVLADELPHDLVRGVVEREAARGPREREHRAVRRDHSRAPRELRLVGVRGGLGDVRSRRLRRRGRNGRLGEGHQY